MLQPILNLIMNWMCRPRDCRSFNAARLTLLIALLLVNIAPCTGLSPAARARAFPPRGYNPCNGFNCHMDQLGESTLMSLADALVSTGAASAGYTWLILDDGWQAMNRSAAGELMAEAPAFPSGTLRPLADYAAARGLALGAYSDRGSHSCEGRPGSAGHEAQDAATFASWNIQWLKEDSCSAPASFAAAYAEYEAMAAGLLAAGADVFFELCGWWSAYASFSALTPRVGDAWRVATDVGAWDRWLINIEAAAAAAAFSGPGRGWPDVDMLAGHWPAEQERLKLSFIAVIGAPLLLSWDLRADNASTLPLARYLDDELLAIHGDDAAPAVASRGAYFGRVAGGAVTGPASSTDSPALPVDTAGDCGSAAAQWAWQPSANSSGFGVLASLSAPGYCLGLWDEWPGACLLPLGAQLVPCGAQGGYGCPADAQLWALDAASQRIATAMDWAGNTPRPGPWLSAVGGVPAALYVQEAASSAPGPTLEQRWLTNVTAPAEPATTTLRNAASGACLSASAASATNVWVRWLASGDVAVLFFNAGASSAAVTCDAACFARVGAAGAVWAARDVWTHEDAGRIEAAAGFTTPPLAAVGGSLLLRLTPA